MRVIFVPVSDTPECVVALKSAFSLGYQLDASVHGCHFRPHKESSISLTTNEINAGQTKCIHAKKVFEKLANDNDYKLINKPKKKPGALWLEKTGTTSKIFSIMGPVSDLIIVSRPIKEGSSIAREFMMSAILKSSSPVLVLPQSQFQQVGKIIAIAWNQSPQAALAVSMAMPLLCKAKQVNILTFGEESKVGPKSSHLTKYLASWGIKAQRLIVEGKNDAQSLLGGYKQSQSDLLVMGGYSRNRLRQRVFGGVTDYMLNKANIPVLMMHTQ